MRAPARRVASRATRSSTMWPSPKRITRSAISAMPALCVISAVAVPSSRFTASIASSTSTPVALSSAPVGSSHSSSCGFLAIARAIATRCCSPPESCAGKVVEALAEADQAQRVLGRHRRLGDLRHQRDVLARGQARDQVVELEHEADVLAPVAREPGLVARGQLAVVEPDVAGGRRVEPAEDVQQRRLAAARRARAARSARAPRARDRRRAARARPPRPCGRPWSGPPRAGSRRSPARRLWRSVVSASSPRRARASRPGVARAGSRRPRRRPRGRRPRGAVARCRSRRPRSRARRRSRSR